VSCYILEIPGTGVVRMRVYPQEVYLHGLGKLPDYCYSLDLSWTPDEVFVVTGGADSIARIWKVKDKTLEIHSELTGHQLGVNCVRFSPDGRNSIATASDDGKVVVWHKSELEEPDGEGRKERWMQGRILNVLDEVTCIAWSPCGTMIAAAVQREMTHIFSATTGRLLARLDGHTNRVTGVCWDPLGSLIVSQSSDRTSRVYAKKRNGNWYPKALLKEVEGEASKWKLFISESHYPNDPTAHFFRRPEFSPDGSMVVLPGGLGEPCPNSKFVTHLYSRKNLQTGQPPTASLTTPCSPATAVRFHPRSFLSNIEGEKNFYVFVVTTVSSFYVMRSDRAKPIAFGTDLHCTAIVDASWNYDGTLLAVCSTDGYMTLIRFEVNELGGRPDWSTFKTEKPETSVVKENIPEVVREENIIIENQEIGAQKRRITPMIVTTKE
jgi:chromatin assembly factor 1 subunit B